MIAVNPSITETEHVGDPCYTTSRHLTRAADVVPQVFAAGEHGAGLHLHRPGWRYPKRKLASACQRLSLLVSMMVGLVMDERITIIIVVT